MENQFLVVKKTSDHCTYEL